MSRVGRKIGSRGERTNGLFHLLIHGVLLGLYSSDIQVVGKFSEMQVVYRDLVLVFEDFGDFTPRFGEMIQFYPILTSMFFRWIET